MKVKRTLDARMLELNRQGYLNGHTPFSALVAFSSLIGAAILDLDYVALSNESSANESTVPGSSVNHQYSKSFEFEKDFHQYAGRYLPGSAYYFSLLRPLSEFQIAWIFSGLKQYHDIFRSCNSGSKTDSWCGHCPKCLFVCLILSPFLGQEELEKIFGRAMLEDLSLRETLTSWWELSVRNLLSAWEAETRSGSCPADDRKTRREGGKTAGHSGILQKQ